jgi:hypothetical protein
MSSRYFLDLDPTDGQLARYEAIAASLGVGSAHKVIRTGADGKIDLSFVPDTTGGSPEIIVAEADIAAYSFVSLRYSSGRKVRGALATDNTRPAVAFCPEATTNGNNATIYVGGIVEADPTGFTTADTGKLLFLSTSTAGKAGVAPPSAANNIVQVVGRIIEVSTVMRVEIKIDPRYVKIVAAS